MHKKIPQLDAIRGVAILVVILHNSGHFANGWMGVDLFFVLSGFLITGILVDSKPSEGYFKNFYMRRCLRIWPLYYSLLILMFVIVPHLRTSETHSLLERSSPAWAYPLFLQNFLVRVPTMALGPLGVTWSLAVEEQFYLVWPWVVRYCSSAQVRRVAWAVICISPALRLFLSSRGVDTYPNLFCRLDGLMAGAILALTVRSHGFVSSRYLRTAWTVFLIAAPSAFLMEALHQRWITFSLTAAASASFVYLALFSKQRGLQWVLTNRFLIYTGSISYGLYLLHKLPFDGARALHADEHPWLTLLVAVVVSYILAALSWNLLEKPFLKLKRFFESKPIPDQGADQFGLLPQKEN